MSYIVPFVNYPEHYKRIWDEIRAEVDFCLSHGDLIMRKQVDDFEQSLADFVGTKYAITLNSGTDALFFSLKAAGIKPGDEVITVSHTFVATIAAIHYCGATPILIDVEKDSMNMDTTLIEASITSKTKAIIPVHLNGRMCDMDNIMEIAHRKKLEVVEDAAQSLGARYNKYYQGKAGSFGLTGCFSFYPAKVLGCAGDGGAITTNDTFVAEQVKLLRDHGYKRSTGDIVMYGYNSRLDNIQAAMLNVKLKYLPVWIQHRRSLADVYDKYLQHLPEVKIPVNDSSGKFYDIYQNYVIRAAHRDELYAYLKESGVETLISWPKPTHKHMGLHLSQFNLPVTEQLSQEVISLPMYPELSFKGVKYVTEKIKEFYKW
jgi:dTDP-4-amino-4,6-dideoxygalactose transaminase